MKSNKMVASNTQGRKLVAPDGGWGWVAVFGVSIINLATRSIEPSFGLLFGDTLKDLGVATTGASLIMSTLDATVNFSGLFVGPLIKRYSYRKVATVGSILSAFGLLLTTPAVSMVHILLTYSFIGGLGVGLAWSSTFVALNHYFVKYRGQAIGLSMAGTGVGMMLMPQAVQLLLEAYDFQGAVLILGGVALNATVGSMLLQPVKWHLKPEKKNEKEEKNSEEMVEKEPQPLESAQSPLLSSKIEVTPPVPGEADVEKGGRKRSAQHLPRIVSASSMSAARRRKESVISNISSMDFTGSTFHIHAPLESDEEDEVSSGLVMKSLRNKSSPALSSEISKIDEMTKEVEEKMPTVVLITPPLKRQDTYWRRVVNFMDLDLLKDLIYLNILFGLSIFYVAELNFKMIVPFFLDNLGYSKQDIAFFLSMTAVSDIAARLVLPPICDRINISRRTLFALASVFLGISRSALAEQTEYTALMITLVINGFFRGATLINFTLTISEHCTLEKLPAAFGLHMVAKGLFIVVFGPLIGVIRDESGSFSLCIHSQTVMILLCILAWGIEYLVLHLRNAKNKEQQCQ